MRNKVIASYQLETDTRVTRGNDQLLGGGDLVPPEMPALAPRLGPQYWGQMDGLKIAEMLRGAGLGEQCRVCVCTLGAQTYPVCVPTL